MILGPNGGGREKKDSSAPLSTHPPTHAHAHVTRTPARTPHVPHQDEQVCLWVTCVLSDAKRTLPIIPFGAQPIHMLIAWGTRLPMSACLAGNCPASCSSGGAYSSGCPSRATPTSCVDRYSRASLPCSARRNAPNVMGCLIPRPKASAPEPRRSTSTVAAPALASRTSSLQSFQPSPVPWITACSVYGRLGGGGW